MGRHSRASRSHKLRCHHWSDGNLSGHSLRAGSQAGQVFYSAERGSSVLESLLALLLFSVSLIGMLSILASSLAESAHAQYRVQASLLATGLVARMSSGDRSLAALQSNYGDTSAAAYRQWLQTVEASLPGVRGELNLPTVLIHSDRRIDITLRWQAPAERDAHRWQVQTLIVD